MNPLFELERLLELDELKTGSTTAITIQEVLRTFLSFQDCKKRKLVELLEQIRRCYQKMLVVVARRRSITSKLDKLYCLFHEFTVSEGFTICSSCEKELEMVVPEIVWQLLIEKEFIRFLTTELKPKDGNQSQSNDQNSPRVLSEIEKNAVRYTGGYVIRKVEEIFSKKRSKEAAECVTALQEMGSKLQKSSSTSGALEEQQPSNKWTSLVNRGGLYFIQNEVFDLFITIEILVDNKLTKIFNEGGKDIELVKKDNLAWVCEDDDVESVWSYVSPNSIEEEATRDDLLREIVHMWITIRGHSKAHKIKEDYKLKNKKGVKGTRSLRKELDSQ